MKNNELLNNQDVIWLLQQGIRFDDQAILENFAERVAIKVANGIPFTNARLQARDEVSKALNR